MKLNLLFVVNAVLAGVFGLGLIFFPSFVSDFYAVQLSPAGQLMGQMLGACLAGFAILSWLAKGLTDYAARRTLAVVFFLGYLIAFLVSLLAQLNGVLNALAWVNVAGYAVLSAAFGYFLLTRKN